MNLCAPCDKNFKNQQRRSRISKYQIESFVSDPEAWELNYNPLVCLKLLAPTLNLQRQPALAQSEREGGFTK
jgi:hypothetical protein